MQRHVYSKYCNTEFEMSKIYPVLNVDKVGARFMGCLDKESL
jgi:hypothetical protein